MGQYSNLVFANSVNLGRTLPAATIRIWGQNYIPDGWLECNGSQVWIDSYPSLYATLTNNGTQPNPWGSASSGYFKLPDFRGLFLRGYGTFSTADVNQRKQVGSEYTSPANCSYSVDRLIQHRHWFDIYYGHHFGGGGMFSFSYYHSGQTSPFGPPTINAAAGSDTANRNKLFGSQLTSSWPYGSGSFKPHMTNPTEVSGYGSPRNINIVRPCYVGIRFIIKV